MKIVTINPTTAASSDQETEQEFASYASPGTQISVARVDYGPASIECELDKAICVPGFLHKARQAESEGYDAVISNCYCDPGVKPARELLNIPVVGPAESSMHLAATLGHRFSVVTVLPNIVPAIEHLASEMVLTRNLPRSGTSTFQCLSLQTKASSLTRCT
jgi:allantoin racemase